MKTMLVDGSIPAWIRQDPNKPEVLKSSSGWYIGTVDNMDEPCGMPYARWTHYIGSKEEAQKLLDSGEWKRIARYNP